MKRAARMRSGLACALAGMILLSGCNQLGLGDARSGGPGSSVTATPAGAKLPAGVPRTFAGGPQWAVEKAVPGSVRVTRYGILALFGTAEKRTVALLDPQTGQPNWTSAAFPSAERVHLELVNHDGRPWAVVWYAGAEDHTVQVRSYDVLGPGVGGKAEAHVEDFTGSTTPQVVATSGGLLISGVTDSPPFIWWPFDGARTRYGTGPALNGKAGKPVAAYNNGFIVSFPGGGFSYATAAGGWPANTDVPAGGVRDTGRIVAVEQGLILAAWDQTIGGTVLAVHSQQTGQVLSQQVQTPRQPVDDVPGSLVVAPDDSWAAYGGYVFDLRTEQSRATRWRDLHGGEPVSIYDGVIYLREVQGALSGPLPPCPIPDESGTPTAGPTSAGATSAGATSAGPNSAGPSGAPSPSGSTTPCEPDPMGTPTASSSASSDSSRPSSSSASSSSPGATASAQPSGRPSAGGTPGAPMEFSGFAAVDATTGVVVDQGSQTVPLGVSSTGSGIFTTEPSDDNAPVTIFSVAFR